MILSGIEVSNAICEALRWEIQNLREQDIIPKLVILRVGASQDDISYERSAKKKLESLGILVDSVVMPEEVLQDDVLEKIEQCNRDTMVHGILLFFPLPKHLDGEKIRNHILPSKDIDGMSDISLAKVFTGSQGGFAPCTAQAVMEILEYYQIEVMGKNVVILGRSTVIGRPVAMLLLTKNATPILCHSKTKDIAKLCREADIIISAVGQAKFVKKEMVGEKSIIIDVGINFLDGKLVGDVDFLEVSSRVQAISPVPRGVGSITTSVLAKHLVESAKRS